MPLLSRKQLRESLRSEATHTEIREELQFHIDSKTEELIRDGMSPEEARELAVKRFGSASRVQEDGFEVRGQHWLEQLATDMVFALRLLRKHPGKTSILVATLALGIGANTAAFGVVQSILLNPLPFSQPEQLVVLRQSSHGARSGVSYPHFQDWRERGRSFSGMSVFLATSATLSEGVEPTRINGAIVSSSIFSVLGVEPLRGRLFRAEEDQRGMASSVVISDRLWRTRFRERGDILGQLIKLDGRAYQIAGIVSAREAFPITKYPVDYWITVAADADPALYGGTIPTSRGYPRYDGVIARLGPNATIRSAWAEMGAIAANLAREHSGATSANEVLLLPALEEVVGPSSRMMVLLLYAAVFCVLVVACINIANIQLTDALARRREFALRTALGARASRLVRQVIAESLTLTLLGGLASIAVAFGLIHLFVAFAPSETPRIDEIGFDSTVIGYVVAISLLSGILLGCLPAFATHRHDLATALKEGAGTGIPSRRRMSSGPGLLCLQIALGMVLTCSALQLAASFYQILHSPRGFNPDQVLTASISLPPATYGQRSERVRNFYRSLLEQARSLPGVESASVAEALPLSGDSNGTTVTVEGSTEPGLPSAGVRFIEPQYFRTLQMSMRSGRSFTNEDAKDRAGCVIVNESFVRRFLLDRSPSTVKVRLGWGGNGWKQIVGVVNDIRAVATSPATEPEVYVPFAQFSVNDMALLVRTTTLAPESLTAALVNIVRKLDPQVPLDRIRTLDEYRLTSAAPNRFLMLLLIAFAGLTLLLAAIGIYGVLSNRNLARTQEFSIRLALGAPSGHVMALVLRQGLVLASIGIAAGLAMTVVARGALMRWMYQSSAVPIAIYFASGLVILVVVVAASAIPSRRASRVNPVSVLRTA